MSTAARFEAHCLCSLILVVFLFPALALADGGYLLGVNLQADDADGLAATLFGDVSISEATSISGALGRSTVDVSQASDSESVYADIGVDHRFGLAGVRLSAAYWGDSDLLDSRDLRASVYLSGDLGSIGFEIEERDFDFQLPPSDLFARTSIPFDARGVGLNASLNVSDDITLFASGMEYDYSVPFRLQETDRIRQLLVISRLSVLSSLVDWRASAGIGVRVGEQRWGLDLSTWEGRITGTRNDSATLSFLTPIGLRTDMELGLGVDRSELFGDVTVASLRFFYYGGN